MSSFNCEKCGTMLHDTNYGYISGCEHYPIVNSEVASYIASLHEKIDRLKSVGLTARGEPMPQTVEEWRYLYGLAEQALIEGKATISKLKQRINKMEKKNRKQKK